jgi:hypothetical protein
MVRGHPVLMRLHRLADHVQGLMLSQSVHVNGCKTDGAVRIEVEQRLLGDA